MKKRKRLRKKYKWALCQYDDLSNMKTRCRFIGKKCVSEGDNPCDSWKCKNFTVMRQQMKYGRPGKLSVRKLSSYKVEW